MNVLIKALALLAMILVPAISGRVLKGWPAALDDDFQDRADLSEARVEGRGEAREEPVETMLKQLEGRDFTPSKEAFGKQAELHGVEATSGDQGYFQSFAPREIVLDDNQSIESRFNFPDFPKMDFPFDAPFGGERQQQQ
ncbi:uncharacterized protein LOC130703670 [Daphnia carinata]|uniref:uncharacterized protein LOC130703670 n=1 Tax=Daphnia carinata TaxID=120202 RepID=UPI002580DA12|nr:uncharacterized protein LOC130703670 [Daphnia carinata]